MIAMKREVAAGVRRFSVERMSSLKTGDKSLYKVRMPTEHIGRDDVKNANFWIKGVRLWWCEMHDTHGRVYSHRLSYLEMESAKRRRLFLWQVR